MERNSSSGCGRLSQSHVRYRAAPAEHTQSPLSPPRKRCNALAYIASTRHFEYMRPHRILAIPSYYHWGFGLVLGPRWSTSGLPKYNLQSIASTVVAVDPLAFLLTAAAKAAASAVIVLRSLGFTTLRQLRLLQLLLMLVMMLLLLLLLLLLLVIMVSDLVMMVVRSESGEVINMVRRAARFEAGHAEGHEGRRRGGELMGGSGWRCAEAGR